MTTAPDPTQNLAALQAQTLFVIRHGRLTAINDVGHPAPPRCFLSCTASAVQAWTSIAVPADLADELHRWAADQPPATLAEAVSPPAEAARLLARHAPVTHSFVGPAFVVPDSTDEPTPPGITLRNCGPSTAPLFRETFPEVADSIAERQPTVAAFDGDRPVAVCCAARNSGAAYEAGTETLPTHRGRHLAPALVARWARLVRARGATPLYSTEWDNRASLSVARRLGMDQYAVNVNLY
ncbi:MULTISPECIES: GNAT family N-acetyltransferase [unclassified Streptomyces]|uniref:GNAT family N-acetyltransferase n=1 Tax=unclassified Streptomyces TaxID=2593676 RepID=UPI000381349E|nr:MULTISPECIES: GNAT family N-acetyltransferase [unclassified Streptomyces]MYT29978.1 GNAT family N-acetyltransferase [Streptomyces sp. SID8354]